jgi:hypothetical protein
MKPISTFLILVLAAIAAAQTSAPAKPARAVIDGVVTKDPGSEPVKKALIELIAESQNDGGNYTAVSGPDGAFHIEGIAPGRYHLFAERSGLLEFDKHHARSEGRVLTLVGGQELKDLSIRLQAAAVVRGRVTDEDGEPMPNAQVSVLRQSFSSGRSRLEQAGAEHTNDLGEYRVANLPAGNYFVSVSPPPDFKSLIEGAANGPLVDPHTIAAGQPPTSYQTTYYPGTPDRSQASPVQLHPGDDFPANFSLLPTPSLSIRGSVVNLPPRASASVMLQSRDFNLVLNGAETHKDGSFVIRDVAPGSYTILATVEDSTVPLMARQALQIASSSVDDLRLAPQPGAWIHGRLRVEIKGNSAKFDPSQIFLTLRPSDPEDEVIGGMFLGEGFFHVAHVAADGSFEWKGVPPGNYYVQLAAGGTTDTGLFLKSALAGSRDVNESGISVSGGTAVLDLLASANGAVVDGMAATQKGEAIANAVVVAVPEAHLRARVDRYHKTVTDQSGHFTLRGLPPGDYTLLAWESVDGDAYYSPEFLRNYEGQGSPLRVIEGDRKSVQLQVIPDPEDQQ